MSLTHTQLINHFYTRFQDGDYKAMQACYHRDAKFSDPVFPKLNRNEVFAMWHMLLETRADAGLSIVFSNVHTEEDEGQCQWEARYKLSLTNRQVHNIIHARFKFRDGLIIEHQDHFEFYKWSRMAFGFKGTALGWTNFFKNKVQQTVQRRLTKFIAHHSEYNTIGVSSN